MRRSRDIRLVLLGGGVVLASLSGCSDPRGEECERARRELRPDAEQICARYSPKRSASSVTRTAGSWFVGRGASGGAAAATAASSRGGFGAMAARFSAGS